MRLLAVEHRRLRLPHHLDIPHRIVEVLVAEVEVVEPQCLLVDGRVLFLREREHGRAVVIHVVPPHLVRAIGEPVRMLVVRRCQQQPRRVRRSARHHDDVRGQPFGLPVLLEDDVCHRRPGCVRLELYDLRVRPQRDVGMLQRRPHAERLGIGLRAQRAREAIAVLAAHAFAVRHVRGIEHHAAGRVERVIARPLEVVRQLLDARLVRQRRIRVRPARRRLRWVLSTGAVHLVHLFGLQVVRLHLVVADGPGRRDPVVVLQLAEVLAPQPVERRAVHLRGAANEVVHLRLKRLAALILPRLRRDVAVPHEHVFREPVLRLSAQPVAAFQQRIFLPVGARCRASVPPPAPVPMMMTS